MLEQAKDVADAAAFGTDAAGPTQIVVPAAVFAARTADVAALGSSALDSSKPSAAAHVAAIK